MNTTTLILTLTAGFPLLNLLCGHSKCSWMSKPLDIYHFATLQLGSDMANVPACSWLKYSCSQKAIERLILGLNPKHPKLKEPAKP